MFSLLVFLRISRREGTIGMGVALSIVPIVVYGDLVVKMRKGQARKGELMQERVRQKKGSGMS